MATTYYIYPVAGDNWPQLQNAINYQLKTPNVEVVLAAGVYSISKPLIFATIQNGKYIQCTPRFRGSMNAKNVPDAFVSRILPTFTDGPAIGLQLAKGGYVNDLAVIGKYKSISDAIQVATYSDAQWDDGICRQNRSSPYAGVAVDFASDPAVYVDGYEMYPTLGNYYIPGMSRSGSTAVNFDGLRIQHFVLGAIITPSNQQNGEIIHFNHCQIDYCKTPYAMCQAQSKQCEINDFECWGGCRTIFDNYSWGFRHGDGAGSPMINGANIAGNNYQLFWIDNSAFHGSYNNIYAESIFKLGKVGGSSGAQISNSEIDFMNSAAGVPSPDYYMFATNVIHTNCTYRIYAGAAPKERITVAGWHNTFIGGQQTMPPVCSVGGQGYKPIFQNVGLYYDPRFLNTNDYDTILWQGESVVHVDKTDYSGWFIGQGNVGDVIVTARHYLDINEFSYYYMVGFVTKVEGNKIYLDNIGVGINDGEEISLWQLGINNF